MWGGGGSLLCCLFGFFLIPWSCWGARFVSLRSPQGLVLIRSPVGWGGHWVRVGRSFAVRVVSGSLVFGVDAQLGPLELRHSDSPICPLVGRGWVAPLLFGFFLVPWSLWSTPALSPFAPLSSLLCRCGVGVGHGVGSSSGSTCRRKQHSSSHSFPNWGPMLWSRQATS